MIINLLACQTENDRAEVDETVHANNVERTKVVCICAGEPDSLVSLLQHSTSAAQRMQVLECIKRDTPDVRAKLANDAGCLGALEEWVLDLLEDRMSFHVLETLLKVSLLS